MFRLFESDNIEHLFNFCLIDMTILGVKVPIAILGAEIDKMSLPELVKEFKAALEAKPEVIFFN